MKRVVLESPFAGNIERNIEYAKLCIRDMLLKDEAPIASHLLFTQPGILNDNDKEQRKLGIEAGHSWIRVADTVVVYTDFGISPGMEIGITRAMNSKVDIQYRNLPDEQINVLKQKYPEVNSSQAIASQTPKEQTGQGSP